MAQKETSSKMYGKIRAVRSTNAVNSHFTSLQIPQDWPELNAEVANIQSVSDPKAINNQDDKWRTIELPEEILYYLRLRNRLHFGQAEGTPFTAAPLRELVDWEASTKVSDLILDGDYSNTELSELQQIFLDHCKKSVPLDSISAEITEAQFKSRFRAWRESTTTSPSGIDLGHYKALVNDHALPPNSVEADIFEAKRNERNSSSIHL
jgi:hypothetical protein